MNIVYAIVDYNDYLLQWRIYAGLLRRFTTYVRLKK